MCVLPPSGATPAAAGEDVCARGGLAGARVSASAKIRHDDYAYARVETSLTVEVPAGWKHAKALLLSRESWAYNHAMTCLTGQWPAWSEFRPQPPVVTTKKDRIKVVRQGHSWLNWDRSDMDVGTWHFRAEAGAWVAVTLRPPPALAGSRWDRVTMDPGPPGVETAEPPPTAKEGASTLVWRPEKAVQSAPAVTVSVRPPWETECATAGLAGARVDTSVEFQHADRTHTKVETDLTVDVPINWKHAKALLLSRESRAYINAMACLTRLSEEQQAPRWSELRPHSPVVTTREGRVKVVYQAHSWVNRYQEDIDVGIWRVRAKADVWTATLMPPTALADSRWDRITVDPGPPGAETAEPPPTAKEGTSTLVWRQRDESAPSPPAVSVSLKPSWQRLWAAQNDRLTAAKLDTLGGLLWTLTMSGLLLRAAFLFRKRTSLRTPRQKLTLRNLELWAFTVVALFLLIRADDLIRQYDQASDSWWLDDALLRGHVFALAAAALLFSFAKPPRSIWVAVALLMLPPLATMTLPEVFGLCESCTGTWEGSSFALASQTTASCCLLALTVLGFVAVAWRLAVDAGLLPKSRRPAPSGQRRDRVLQLRIAGPAVVVSTLLVALCYALTEERNWQRATWPINRWTDEYKASHLEDFVWESVWSTDHGQEWILSYSWMLTTVALLGVLRTWRASTQVPLNDRADRLLFLTFFPVAVAIGGGRLGNALPEVLWIPLYMLALYAAVGPLRRHAVLRQRFEGSVRYLTEGIGPNARRDLLKKARIYRETHAELRRLDQGLFGDKPPERARLERALDRLHTWPASGPSAGTYRIPEAVSVVDAALALGPRDNWWDNGVRGARLALIPGLPAAVLGVWSGSVRGEAWQDTFTDLLGIPGMVLEVLYWVSTWVGAGFVLGALWRILPGRRGAIKALPVASAFALPMALDALFGWFTQEGAANLALYASTMLFVLTVTGIALDLDTFRTERRFWQSRLGLLLSVYQMRYYSLQVAYLIGQVIALITIWKFFAEPSATPPDGDK
ncbi:DUF6185 family protein [Streptomyces chartreusis]